MIRRIAIPGVVALALALLYLAAWKVPGSTAGAPPAASVGTPLAASAVARTCPPPGPNTGVAHIAMVALPAHGASSTAQAGSAKLSALPSGMPSSGATAAAPAGAAVTVSGTGSLTVTGVPEPARYDSTTVNATGAMAQGFEAEMSTSLGMGIVSCTHPGSDMWFIGAGTATGAPVTRLYLMNPGSLAAAVEVAMLTDSGVQQGLNAAITVGPGQYMWEDIAKFTGGSQVQALHVQTSSGQVAAAVWQGPARGPGGTWLPQAAAPAKTVVVPGLTTASSAARLFIVVPGSADAQVTVKALTARGTYAPFGPAAQDAPSGAATSLSLTSLGTSAAAIVLTSNVPVTAGIAVPGSGIGSFSAAAEPVTEQGIAAGNPVGHGTVSLLLSAPANAVTATVMAVPGAAVGQSSLPPPRTVQVAAHSTVAITVGPPNGTRQPFAIVVTPGTGSGPLYAARVVTSGGPAGQVLSILPVRSALTQISLPPTRNSYQAILP